MQDILIFVLAICLVLTTESKTEKKPRRPHGRWNSSTYDSDRFSDGRMPSDYDADRWRELLSSVPIFVDSVRLRKTVCERAMTNFHLCEAIEENAHDIADFLQCPTQCGGKSPSQLERRRKSNCDRPDFSRFCSTAWPPQGFKVKCKECYMIKGCDIVSSQNDFTFDGLGHYVIKYVRAVANDISLGTVRSYKEMFRDSFRFNAIYLQGFSDDIDANWDLYCHQRDANVAFTADMDFNQKYICYSTPNLDSWFHIKWLLPRYEIPNSSYSASTCLDAQFVAKDRTYSHSVQTVYENYFKRSYWNAPQHTDNLVSCGQRVRNMLEFKVSIHLRIGDLLFGSFRRKNYYQNRLLDSLSGFFEALKYADHYIATNLPTSQPRRLLVVSDLPGNSSYSEVMRIFAKSQGSRFNNVSLLPILGSKFNDGMSSVMSFHTKLPHLPRLDLMLDANPLVSLHCMAQANLTIASSLSNFGILAGALSSGRFVQPTLENKTVFHEVHNGAQRSHFDSMN